MRQFMVSVIGGHKSTEQTEIMAEEIGRTIAGQGAVLVCGGLGGVMEAACRGAKSADGLTVGIIPGNEKERANEFVDVVIPTDMGYSRNTLVAGAGDMVVALPGEYGTLSEISFALIGGKPVYGFETWNIEGVFKLQDAEQLRKAMIENMR